MASDSPRADTQVGVTAERIDRWVAHPKLALLCRVALGIVFLSAGLPKLLHPQLFLIAVRGYMMLPDATVPTFTVVLPMIEVVVGSCLIAGLWVRASSLLVGSLLMMFLAGMVVAMARGLDIECGCFGHASAKLGPAKIAEDAAMLVMLIPLIIARSSSRQPLGRSSV